MPPSRDIRRRTPMPDLCDGCGAPLPDEPLLIEVGWSTERLCSPRCAAAAREQERENRSVTRSDDEAYRRWRNAQ